MSGLNRSKCSGLSIVELLVALAVSMILMTAVLSIFSSMNAGYGELMKSSRQLENGRYAMQLIKDDLRHAGFYGEYYESEPLPTTIADTDPCDTDLTEIQKAFPLAVQTYNGDSSVAAKPLTCISDDYKRGTDILVVRRASTETTTLASLTAKKVYLQSRSQGYLLQVASASAPTNATNFNLTKKDGTTLADIREFLVHIYYITDCRDCSGSGDGIPTLRREELGIDGSGGRAMVSTSLVDGIEELQLDLGIAADADEEVVELTSGQWAQSPKTMAQITAGVASDIIEDWANTLQVGVRLLARNIEKSAVSDGKTYQLGETGGTYNPSGADEKYKRHYFGSVTRVVNVAARREVP